jgi:hypothetical protein
MASNKSPNHKQPGEKEPGTFHYNPGNMSGKNKNNQNLQRRVRPGQRRPDHTIGGRGRLD